MSAEQQTRVNFEAMGLDPKLAIDNFRLAHQRAFGEIEPPAIDTNSPVSVSFIVAWGGFVDPELYKSISPGIIMSQV
jgi:hypothetical protein